MTQSDPQQPPPEQQNPVLDYGKRDPAEMTRNVVACGAGVVVAIPAVLILGCGVFNAGGYSIGPVPMTAKPRLLWPIASFATLAIAAAVGLYFAFKAQRRRWFVIGLLLGAGTMALVEGACFTNP